MAPLVSRDEGVDPSSEPGAAAWRQRLYVIIFEADTPAGRAFDVALLWAIGLSVLAVSLESVAAIDQAAGG